MFFERMRKEIKRSLKVTIDTIKLPENLGARKKDRSSVQIYPSLPTADEVTEEDSTKKTLKWVNNTGDGATKNNAKVTISTDPPDYEQSERSRKHIVHDDYPI